MSDNPLSVESETSSAGDSRLRRGIKSYVLRAGRMTVAQTRGLEEVWPRLGLSVVDGPLNLDALFGRAAPRVVDARARAGAGAKATLTTKGSPPKTFALA